MKAHEAFETIFNHDPQLIVGVDEAGRGAMAGPVVVAAVMLPAEWSQELDDLLDDSKNMSPAKREQAHDLIIAEANSVSIAMAEPQDIDTHNVLWATMQCMADAAEEASAWANADTPANVLAVFDGNVDPYENSFAEKPAYITSLPVAKADGMVPAVMAAGIIAKVTRDRFMASHATDKFAFNEHFGYVTEKHKAELAEHGPIEGFHRFSYAPVKEAQILFEKEQHAHSNS